MRCERVTLFVNYYEVISWGFGGEAVTNEQEGRQGKWERGDSREWKISEALAVFKEIFLKEHWVYYVSTYL